LEGRKKCPAGRLLYACSAVLAAQGPDGAPGFGIGRGKGLEAALAEAADAAPGSAPGVVLAFAGLPLRGILARSLSVEALPFVPGA